MLERFGSKSLRLFRLLLTKEHLEQKQVTVFSEQVSKYFYGIVSLLFDSMNHSHLNVWGHPRVVYIYIYIPFYSGEVVSP